MNVVIIDNEPTILRSLEILIKPRVNAVTCFTNPNVALQYLIKHGHIVDILLVDYFMPEMNGLELITRCVPFIKPQTVKVIMSGHIELIPQRPSERWHVDHVLSKPFNLNCLLSLLEPAGHSQTYEQQ